MSAFNSTETTTTYGFITLNADGSEHGYTGTFETREEAEEVMARLAVAPWHKKSGRTFRLVEEQTTFSRRYIA